MSIPAERTGGDQHLLFPPLDEDPHLIVEKDSTEVFAEKLQQEFTAQHREFGMPQIEVQECGEGEVPLDATLTRARDRISFDSFKNVDVMLQAAEEIFCQACGRQGLIFSKHSGFWACTICSEPGFGELSRTRYFVGRLETMRELTSGLFEAPNFSVKRATVPDGHVRLFSPDLEASNNINNSDGGEQAQRKKSTIRRILRSGNTRPFAKVMADWSIELDQICIEHPNFEGVIEMNVRPSLAVLAAGGKVRAAPLLIYGDPGVGKSHFAQRIAKMVHTPFCKIDMAAAQSGSSLTGSASFWSNTEPGRVFNTLLFGADEQQATIDPLLFLDEIDKTSADRYNPLSGLYSLLEIESAKHFEDESYPGVELNASYIRWILAANDPDKIPSPIRSRCQEFSIPQLTQSQKETTYARIFENVVRECGLPAFDQCLRGNVLDKMLEMGMREYKTACSVAVGRALTAGRNNVILDDFRANALVHSARARIGFLP